MVSAASSSICQYPLETPALISNITECANQTKNYYCFPYDGYRRCYSQPSDYQMDFYYPLSKYRNDSFLSIYFEGTYYRSGTSLDQRTPWVAVNETESEIDGTGRLFVYLQEVGFAGADWPLQNISSTISESWIDPVTKRNMSIDHVGPSFHLVWNGPSSTSSYYSRTASRTATATSSYTHAPSPSKSSSASYVTGLSVGLGIFGTIMTIFLCVCCAGCTRGRDNTRARPTSPTAGARQSSPRFPPSEMQQRHLRHGSSESLNNGVDSSLLPITAEHLRTYQGLSGTARRGEVFVPSSAANRSGQADDGAEDEPLPLYPGPAKHDNDGELPSYSERQDPPV